MILPDEFDAFYKGTRTRLLLQTYALTGDLPAARSAVRDAFVVTWHHWRKVNRLPDPETWVRPRAWSQAQRRHTARIWHRDKHLDPEARATLESLGKLSLGQRKALLLDQLTDLPPAERARELGVPEAEAGRLLAAATQRFVTLCEIEVEDVPGRFEALGEPVAGASWPRASIVRRAGAARRRTHTLIGAVAAVVAVVATGGLVSGAPATPGPDGPQEDQPSPGASAGVAGQPVASFDADRLLSADAVSLLVDGRRWSERHTSDNTEGDGLATPCQQERFADPDGQAALVRTFETSPRGNEPRVSAVQTAELSATAGDSRRAWRRAGRWYGGCLSPRVQLISTHDVGGVGDQAVMFHLKRWRAPVSTYVVGVARTGSVTTTTVTRREGDAAPDLGAAARLLGRAVNGLCTATADAACARPDPKLVASPPVRVGEVPGMLVESDLPPVPGVGKPWVGTEPLQARDNAAATRCDNADFSKKPMSNAATRTYLIPGTKLPPAFGLTETVGTMPEKRAREFVAMVRRRMASCPDRDPGSDVAELASVRTAHEDLAIWRVTIEVDDNTSVTYLMGIARQGTAIGQVGFVPGRGATLSQGAFHELVRRAAARLDHLPRPPR